MIRATLATASLVAALLTAGAAAAQDPSKDGEYRGSLVKVMDALAAGDCDGDVMTGDLLAACDTELAPVTSALQMLGTPTDVLFLRAEGEGSERIELYEVHYSVGQILTWGLGGLEDGRFTQLSVDSN